MFELQDILKILQKTEIEIYCSEQLNRNTKIFLDLNIDSLTIMEIICLIEKEYGITFTEEKLDFDENLTVGCFLDLINDL